MLLLAIGSRGDVEPMVALAAGLVRAGRRARVVGLADYAPLAHAHGVEFVPVRASVDEALARAETTLGRMTLSTAMGQGLVLRRWMADLAEPFSRALLEAVEQGEEGEVVVTGVLTRDVATALAEARGARPVTLLYTGMLPTLQSESHFFGTWFSPWDAYNRWGTRTNWLVSSSLGRGVARRVRDDLGLAQVGVREATRRGNRFPTVVAASPVLVPRAADWPAGTRQTGQLVLPAVAHEPDPVVTEFLAAGPAPVYVGFGSMTRVSGERARSLVVGAAARSGQRVVTPADQGAPSHLLAPGVLAVAHVPHDWLLPRMSAVVHHGGAGTTGTALRAGVPSAAVAFGADQPYHGRRLHALGVGPAPLSIRRLASPRKGPERLARLLDDLVAGPGAVGFRSRAAELGARCRAEDGVGLTVELLTSSEFI